MSRGNCRPIDHLGNPLYGRLHVVDNPEAAHIWRTRNDEPEPVEIEQTAYAVCDGWPNIHDEISDYTHRLLNALDRKLTKKQRMVLRLRYLADSMTLEQIADMLGVTKERIRQIEGKTLRLARKMSSMLGDPPVEVRPLASWEEDV